MPLPQTRGTPTCKRPGCWKPTWNGKADEYCGRSCQTVCHQRTTHFEPSKIDFDGCFNDKEAGLIAFYFPGREEAWDRLCQSSFLGNFHDMGSDSLLLTAPCDPQRPRCFNNAEAAFQALKFWDRASEFQYLSGEEAFQKRQLFTGKEDWTYGGFGSNWKAMMAVLQAKFRPDSSMAKALSATGKAFLLEHNAVPGRDMIWSDNHNGDGKNWLGLQLMLVRDGLPGAQAGNWARIVKKWINVENGGPAYTDSERHWLRVVQLATRALDTRLEQEKRDDILSAESINAEDPWICFTGAVHWGDDITPHAGYPCEAKSAKKFAEAKLPDCVAFTHSRMPRGPRCGLAWYHRHVAVGDCKGKCEYQTTHCLYIHRDRFLFWYGAACLQQVLRMSPSERVVSGRAGPAGQQKQLLDQSRSGVNCGSKASSAAKSARVPAGADEHAEKSDSCKKAMATDLGEKKASCREAGSTGGESSAAVLDTRGTQHAEPASQQASCCITGSSGDQLFDWENLPELEVAEKQASLRTENNPQQDSQQAVAAGVALQGVGATGPPPEHDTRDAKADSAAQNVQPPQVSAPVQQSTHGPQIHVVQNWQPPQVDAPAQQSEDGPSLVAVLKVTRWRRHTMNDLGESKAEQISSDDSMETACEGDGGDPMDVDWEEQQ